MKTSRNLTIKTYDKKKKYWSDKTLQASVESFYSYYDNFMIEKFDFNHIIKVENEIEINEFKYVQSI